MFELGCQGADVLFSIILAAAPVFQAVLLVLTPWVGRIRPQGSLNNPYPV